MNVTDGAAAALASEASGQGGNFISARAGHSPGAGSSARLKGARSGPYIGRPMPRFEDLRLVRGAGNYTDDVSVPGQTYAVFVRTPHAHARIVAIDAAAARGHPGVLAVLTGDDYL